MLGAEQAGCEAPGFSPSQWQLKVILLPKLPVTRADQPSPGRHKHPPRPDPALLSISVHRLGQRPGSKGTPTLISYRTTWGLMDNGWVSWAQAPPLCSGAVDDQDTELELWRFKFSSWLCYSLLCPWAKSLTSLAAGFHSHKIGNSTLPYLQSALRSLEAQGYGSVFITSIRRYIDGGSQSTPSRSTAFIF